MADLTIWISGADFIKINSFFAREGRRLFEIRSFYCPGRVDFSQTFLAGVGGLSQEKEREILHRMV